MQSPLLMITENWPLFVALMVALVAGITIHEFSHAAVALLQGDRTAQAQGRVTLNPVAHLDPLGSIMMLLAGFGWGKPVPFNPMLLRNARVGSVLISLAGPASNLVLAIAAAVALRVRYGSLLELALAYQAGDRVALLLSALLSVNVLLGVFNLVPVPPLDGSRLFSALWPRSRVLAFLEQYGIFLLLALLLFAGRVLDPLFSAVEEAILSLVGLGVEL